MLTTIKAWLLHTILIAKMNGWLRLPFNRPEVWLKGNNNLKAGQSTQQFKILFFVVLNSTYFGIQNANFGSIQAVWHF